MIIAAAMKGPVAFLPLVVAVLLCANFPTAMGSNRESASQAKRLAYLTQENKRLNDRIEEMQREIEAMGPAMLEEQKEIAARKFNEAEQLRLAKEAELKTQEAKLQEAKAKNETAATNLEQARLQAEAEMHRRTEAEIQLQLKRTETEKLEREARLLELEQAKAHELAVESRERKEAVELELKLLEEERKKIRDEAAAIKEEGRKEGRLESKEKAEARASAMIQQLNVAKELALSQEQAAQAKADALRLELEKEEAALKKAQIDLSSMEVRIHGPSFGDAIISNTSAAKGERSRPCCAGSRSRGESSTISSVSSRSRSERAPKPPRDCRTGT